MWKKRKWAIRLFLTLSNGSRSWDYKLYKYKIVEATNSGVGDLDQYVFVVRERIGRFPECIIWRPADEFLPGRRTSETTSFVDIKSPLLRDILREACRGIRGVSLTDDTPSVRAVMRLRSLCLTISHS